jgi:hypothetical protein
MLFIFENQVYLKWLVFSTKHIAGVASEEKKNSRVSGTGIYPLNPHTFSAEDFLLSAMLQDSSKTVSAAEKSDYR